MATFEKAIVTFLIIKKGWENYLFTQLTNFANNYVLGLPLKLNRDTTKKQSLRDSTRIHQYMVWFGGNYLIPYKPKRKKQQTLEQP